MFIVALGSWFASIYSHSETSNASRADGSVELGLVVKMPTAVMVQLHRRAQLSFRRALSPHRQPAVPSCKAHTPRSLFFSTKFQKDIFSLERNKQRWTCNLASLKNKNVFLHHCRPYGI